MERRLLLTGPPGCGKTTVILKTLRLLSGPVAGFYTAEVRPAGGGRRQGFDVVALGGGRGPLARVGGAGPQVGSYAVDVASFEKIGVRALVEGLKRPETLLVVDELGKMEFQSAAFVDLLEQVFRSRNPVLGTVMERSHPVADRFRRWPDVAVLRVTAENREALPRALAGRLAEQPLS